jgi:hypothetical protein
MESRGFELLLPLLQLVHTSVGRDFCVRRSPAPIDRMRGSPIPPMWGTIIGTHDMSFGGHLTVRVVNDLRHEAFVRGVVAPLARGKIRD